MSVRFVRVERNVTGTLVYRRASSDNGSLGGRPEKWIDLGSNSSILEQWRIKRTVSFFLNMMCTVCCVQCRQPHTNYCGMKL